MKSVNNPGADECILSGVVVYPRCKELSPGSSQLKFLSHKLILRQIPSKHLEEAFDRVVVGVGPKGNVCCGAT